MKTKFFMCMRPTVIETDDGDYIKLPTTVGSSYTAVSGKTSGRRNQLRKRVAPEKYTRQLSVNSNGSNCFSGSVSPVSEGKSENPLEKDSPKTTIPVSGTINSIPFSGDKPVVSNKLNGYPESNSGVYLMAISLFFTIFVGKFFGILCTLVLVYSLYPHLKNDGNQSKRSENMVVRSPERGSPEEYKKRVIMEGLLERKSHHRENIKCLS